MEKSLIPFNKPYLTGKEVHFINDAVSTGKISGDGKYTRLCQDFFEKKYGFGKCLLTSSCTDALEMSAILANVGPGDEVIVPDYTFVSTANAFALRGAKLVFCDSRKDHPMMDEVLLEKLITSKTKAIVCVHYAGDACEMGTIRSLCDEHNLILIEDAAQAIDNYYTTKDGKNLPLGSIGDLATFSFHETKNIISGEGGMLVINDESMMDRAQIIWEKGTNRTAFFNGEVDKYGWVDLGSSFLPSDITAAFLWAQLNELLDIQAKRLALWNRYDSILRKGENELFKVNKTPAFSSCNAHMYYITIENLEKRKILINHLKEKGFHAVFHYLSLSQSKFINTYQEPLDTVNVNSEFFANSLLRLPLFVELSLSEVESIAKEIINFFTYVK